MDSHAILDNRISTTKTVRYRSPAEIFTETQVIEMKKVYCLYRVSTTHQVEYSQNTDGDIPMQKTACHEFADRQGWTIFKEFYEKGVSGYKVSANDRDAIQDLKKAAEKGEFEILLVFKFDRLGRIESETPFILEWFVAHGIEMWSTKEGQQKIETRTDKLINFLRFWQAGTESENTSQRVTTAMRQMVQTGQYVGGVTPYGYCTVKSGKISKHGRELQQLMIHEQEAEVVRMIFEKTVHEGYGSHRMSQYLSDHGYRTHNGARFQCNSINRILSNSIYCGYIRFGEVISPRREDLQIIDDNLIMAAQYILGQRREKEHDKRHIAMNTKGHTLLSGNLFCGHCGSHMIASSWWDRYTRADGTKVDRKRYRYLCYHKARKLCECEGASAYTSDRIDAAILDLIRTYLERIKTTPKDLAIERKYRQHLKELQTRKRQLEKEHEAISRRLQGLTDEIGRSLTGDSRFDTDTLADAIKRAREDLTRNEELLAKCAQELTEQATLTEGLDGKYEQFRSWAEVFDRASREEQKMIVCQLIQRVEIRKGYEITVDFNPTYEQFLGETETNKENASNKETQKEPERDAG